MNFWNDHELSNLLVLMTWLQFFAIGGLVGSLTSGSRKNTPKFIIVNATNDQTAGPTVTQICEKLGVSSIKVSYDLGKTYKKYKANLPNEKDIKITL